MLAVQMMNRQHHLHCPLKQHRLHHDSVSLKSSLPDHVLQGTPVYVDVKELEPHAPGSSESLIYSYGSCAKVYERSGAINRTESHRYLHMP